MASLVWVMRARNLAGYGRLHAQIDVRVRGTYLWRGAEPNEAGYQASI